MRKYIFIGLGSFVGAISRYLIKGVILCGGIGVFPLNTLIINISGAFVMAIIMTAAACRRNFSENLRLGLTTGFLGAYTTFSTLCKETVLLFTGGHADIALLYVFLSVILGLGTAYLGYTLVLGVSNALNGNSLKKAAERNAD